MFMSNRLPKISIITPSFNQAQFIEQTICSVLDQGYPNLEYFVMDGGSTDGTVEILKKYAKHLTGWVSEKDRGQSHALNKGLALATGDVLAYINSDDWYLPGAFQAVGEHFEKNPGTGILHGRCVWTDGAGVRLGWRNGIQIDVHQAGVRSLEDILDLWGVWWNRKNFVQPEVFWSRAMADKVGAFNESLYYCMDYEYWLRGLLAGAQVRSLDQEMACFRFQSQQKTVDTAKVADEICGLVQGYLWDLKTPLTASARRRLQAMWRYHRELQPLEHRAMAQGCSRASRWGRILGYIAANPRVLHAPALRQRLGW